MKKKIEKIWKRQPMMCSVKMIVIDKFILFKNVKTTKLFKQWEITNKIQIANQIHIFLCNGKCLEKKKIIIVATNKNYKKKERKEN